MRSVAGVALIAPARGRASKKIINIMHTGAARCFWKPKWPWVKTKPPKPAKPPKPSTTGRAVCNARFLLREVHVSGALSGACTGKGPQIANPRPTPKPGNLGPPWPPGTSGDPAGYSRGRPLGGSRLSLVRSGSPGADAARLLAWHRRSSYEPDAPARGVPQSPRWRVGLVCAKDAKLSCRGNMNWRPIRGWTRLLHEREMKADSMPERLLIGPGSPPSLDPVYPELSPPLEPCPTRGKREIDVNSDYILFCVEN